MPEMDGFALAAHIRKNPRLVDAAIMMLTSGGRLGDAARCREMGNSASLEKPIRQAELLAAICSVVNRTPAENVAPPVKPHSLPVSVMEGFFASKDQTHLIAALEQAQKTNIDEMQQIQDQHTTKP